MYPGSRWYSGAGIVDRKRVRGTDLLEVKKKDIERDEMRQYLGQIQLDLADPSYA